MGHCNHKSRRSSRPRMELNGRASRFARSLDCASIIAPKITAPPTIWRGVTSSESKTTPARPRRTAEGLHRTEALLGSHGVDCASATGRCRGQWTAPCSRAQARFRTHLEPDPGDDTSERDHNEQRADSTATTTTTSNISAEAVLRRTKLEARRVTSRRCSPADTQTYGAVDTLNVACRRPLVCSRDGVFIELEA